VIRNAAHRALKKKGRPKPPHKVVWNTLVLGPASIVLSDPLKLTEAETGVAVHEHGFTRPSVGRDDDLHFEAS